MEYSLAISDKAEKLTTRSSGRFALRAAHPRTAVIEKWYAFPHRSQNVWQLRIWPSLTELAIP